MNDDTVEILLILSHFTVKNVPYSLDILSPDLDSPLFAFSNSPYIYSKKLEIDCYTI
jgi:hypothetical protein